MSLCLVSELEPHFSVNGLHVLLGLRVGELGDSVRGGGWVDTLKGLLGVGLCCTSCGTLEHLWHSLGVRMRAVLFPMIPPADTTLARGGGGAAISNVTPFDETRTCCCPII